MCVHIHMHSPTSFDQTLYIQYCYFFVISQPLAIIKNIEKYNFREETNEL